MKRLTIIIAFMLITGLLVAQARPRTERPTNPPEETPAPTNPTTPPRTTNPRTPTGRDTPNNPTTPTETPSNPTPTPTQTPTTPSTNIQQAPTPEVPTKKTHHLSLEGLWYTPNEKLDYLLGVNAEYYYPLDKLSFFANVGFLYGETSISETEESNHQIIGGTEFETGSVTSVYLPILLGLRLKYPIGEFQPFVGASFGLGLALQNVFQATGENSEGKPLPGIDDWRPFFGVNWQAQLGVEYDLSPDWVVYAKYYYTGSKLTRYNPKDPENPDIIPPREKFDYSGQGVGIGVRFKLSI